MPHTTRPDFTAFEAAARRKISGEPAALDTASKRAYLWPFINLEALRQGDFLLLFINSRGRGDPGLFAFEDYESCRVGRKIGALQVEEFPGHLMFLDGRTVEMYGRIEVCDRNYVTPNLFRTGGLGFGVNAGVMVLDIQRGVFEFLNKCCQNILHDKGNLLDDQTPNLPEPEAIVTNDHERLSWTSLRTQQPYRTPSKVDFGELSMLAAAQHEAAQDHIFALRADPGYFVDVIADWAEHRMEQILDLEGNSMLDLSHPANQKLLRMRTVFYVVMQAYGDLVLWHGIHKLLTDLQCVTNGLLMTLLPILRNFSKSKVAVLQLGVPASPPLRSGFVRQMHEDGEKIGWKYPNANLYDHLIFLFSQMWQDDSVEKLGLQDVVDELGRTTETSPTEKSRLSNWTLKQLTDLGIILHIMGALSRFNPHADAISQLGWREPEVKRAIRTFLSPYEKLGALYESVIVKVQELDVPNFDYPSYKRRSKQVVERMRKAEHDLDSLWHQIDRCWTNDTSTALHDLFRDYFGDFRSIRRTPEWEEVTKDDTSTVNKVKELAWGAGSFNQDLGDSHGRPPKGHLSKPKVKTRKAISTFMQPPSLPTTVQPDILSSSPTVKIRVSRRALKVFSILFFVPGQADHQGELTWSDFCHAMQQAEFEFHLLYGSVWQFAPVRSDIGRTSIHFHAPYNPPKMSFTRARNFGQRLRDKYGWHGEMFEAK